MKIRKRSGRLVNFNPNNITKRVKDQSIELNVDPDKLGIKVISQIVDEMTTRQLDNLTMEQSATMATIHPDYSILASRIFVTCLHKDTPETFSESVVKILKETSLLDPKYIEFVNKYSSHLNKMIVMDRDFNHDYFGLKTLERSYLISSKESGVIERPQYMWMRTAIAVSNFDLSSIKETYNALSRGYYTHATPTLFNSNTMSPQLSSCFLLAMKDDSIKGIYDTLSDCAAISQWAGGIGVHLHNVRAGGSHIAGTNGTSNGIVPMLKVFNETARYVDQGGGKRKGSFAMYLEPWHADIYDFLELKKNHGKEEMRARDLFYAIWMNDLFMERVEKDEDWSLFCPNVLKNKGFVLQELVGDRFKANYETCEDLGLANKTVKARDLWEKILTSQMETGTPYLGYKDRVNKSNNQKNYGVIKSSNLCIEINEYSDDKEQAVCNLASIALPKFVNTKGSKIIFDFVGLGKVVRLAVKNLNTVIDINYYPTLETKTSNMKHRPIGLGVQGLADVFALMRIPFDSKEAKELNKKIFETMYYYALVESCEQAREHGTYETFWESPAAKGELQFDMYDEEVSLSLDLNLWEELKRRIQTHGLRNSLLLAMMPTASTSQILGNNEAFEPYNSNMSVRRTLSGEFIIVNKHLVRDLENRGLWDEEMRMSIMSENGSVLNIPRVPTDLKELYKTAYEMSMKSVIDMAADRQRFICQSQSMNLFITDITLGKLTSMHFYGWKKGLKTGMYYLRTKSAVNAKKFTMDVTSENKPIIEEKVESVEITEYQQMINRAKLASQNDDDCLMCGS